MFSRHSSAHEYFDPNDFLEGMQHEIEREELEYEVMPQIPSLYYVLIRHADVRHDANGLHWSIGELTNHTIHNLTQALKQSAVLISSSLFNPVP